MCFVFQLLVVFLKLISHQTRPSEDWNKVEKYDDFSCSHLDRLFVYQPMEENFLYDEFLLDTQLKLPDYQFKIKLLMFKS